LFLVYCPIISAMAVGIAEEMARELDGIENFF